MSTRNSSFHHALRKHVVHGEVIEIDHVRSLLGSVETSYIIQVMGKQTSGDEDCSFKAFRISKTFHHFRSLAYDLMQITKNCAKGKGKSGHNSWEEMPESLQNFISCSEAFSQVVDSEPKGHYLGKMSFQYVKDLAKQRKNTLNSSLRVLLENYPENQLNEGSSINFAKLITDFFFTDHVVEQDGTPLSPQSLQSLPSSPAQPKVSDTNQIKEKNTDRNESTERHAVSEATSTSSQQSKVQTPKKKEHPAIVPSSSKERLPKYDRMKIEEDLLENGKELTIDDESIGEDDEEALFDTPMSVALLVLSISIIFWQLLGIHFHINADVAVVVLYAVFVAGRRMSPTPKVIYTMPSIKQSHLPTDDDVTKVIRTSLASTRIMTTKSSSRVNTVADETISSLESPLPEFPKGGTIGTVFNAWSEPVCTDFDVRGKNYLVDKKKITSAPFMFPTRGVDVFISDLCPENIGRYKAIMGGKLRKVPTFLVNFRLPWGNMISYHEIPSKFVPFMRYGYESGLAKPSLDGLSPEEVCVCRFLMGNDDHKNKTLKIIPSVVKGPWIVKKAADGKPAILGTKMTTRYVYQAADSDAGLAEYLEADLDIVGSAAARAILGLAQRYTKVLTLDLGFVIQGNSVDELPERMLMGARLHGIDPVAAAKLPDEMDYFYNEDEKE